MRPRSSIVRMLFLLLVALAPTLWAQDGLTGGLFHHDRLTQILNSPFGPKLAAADFDNDHKPDAALLLDGGIVDGHRTYRIELHVTAGSNSALTFASAEPSLVVSSLDVNRDGTPDLVVEQVFTHKRIQVWLNDGHGNFSAVRLEDFPPFTDTPYNWQTAKVTDLSFVLGLPSKNDRSHALQLFEMLRFGSSSSHWKVRREATPYLESTPASRSPRGPPPILPL